MASNQDVTQLPQDTLDFANRMFDAARNGNSELLLAAIDAGLPVNLTNSKGNTLLMLAVYSGHTELSKEILNRGGDPNRLNDRGQSILAGAIFKGHDAMISLLLEGGADPRLGSQPNAIQAAHMFGRRDLFDILGARDDDIGPEVPTPPSAVA